MQTPRFNWQIWLGFVLSLFAFLSYPTLFVQWPVTRDFPWVNIALFVVAAVLIFLGLRKAFEAGRSLLAKIAAILLSTIGTASFALFVFIAFVMATWLPSSSSAPVVGSQAPDFSLTDTNGKQVSLTELRTAPTGSNKTRGVLLIFYRGYW